MKEPMPQTARPAWLSTAAAVLAGGQFAWFVLHPITVLGAISLGVVVLLAWLLLRGSRVAWVLAILVAASQLTTLLTLGESVWFAAPGAATLLCLLVPSSRAFVWEGKQRETRNVNSSGSVTQRMYDKFLSVVYGLLERAPAIERPIRGKYIILLIIGLLIAAPLVGALDNFHHGSARGNVLIDILWRVVWISFSLAQLAAIILIVIAGARFISNRGDVKSSSAQVK
jgi:hypothetical protein